MPSQYKILIADCPWSIAPERKVFAEIGAELIVAEPGDRNQLSDLVRESDAVLTDRHGMDREQIAIAQRCQAIARYGVGFDNVDLQAATAAGIIVTNVPDYCIDEVTDHAMALLLACARKVSLLDKYVKKGDWRRDIGPPMRRIRGRTLGIIGFGRIGRSIVPKAKAFGLNVIAFDQFIPQTVFEAHDVKSVALSDLLAQSDFVTIHAPLTEETQGLIGESQLRQMKPSAYLINTARGGIINTVALHKALNEGWIAGAGLDVLPKEPPSANEPLLNLENIILTPHIAFLSEESTHDVQTTAAREVAKVLTGQMPQFVVNPAVLDSPALRAKALKK